ncbi:hypothetical protein WHZ77_30090 [Bradyrhizobium sp. A5]|uniref:hypothetical protein n=1 Tax=Bradyrhizobium sp. A5 TaxID=3133696 RepID=UPI0032508C78
MEPPKPSFASRHGNTAQIASAVVAAAALVFVAYQVWSIRTNARIATARQVYMSYSESLLRYPNLVEPNLQKLRADPDEWVRYKNFVAHMLFAYDEILGVYDEPEWRRSFEEDVRFHLPYICADLPAALDDTYIAKMRALLKAERTKCAAAPKS